MSQNQEIPEFARPTAIHGSDTSLSEAVEKSDARELYRRKLASEGYNVGGMDIPLLAADDHEKGAPIIGLRGVNRSFNKGIQHGPWKAPRDDLDRSMRDGYTEAEAQDSYALFQTSQQASINSYPFSYVGESGEIKAFADEEYNKLYLKVGKRVRDQIKGEEAT